MEVWPQLSVGIFRGSGLLQVAEGGGLTAVTCQNLQVEAAAAGC